MSLLLLFGGVTATAAVTGTATASITETDVVAGGKTIIITLTGDTWIAAGAGSFDLQRDEIIAGLDSAQSELLGWNNVVDAGAGAIDSRDVIVERAIRPSHVEQASSGNKARSVSGQLLGSPIEQS